MDFSELMISPLYLIIYDLNGQLIDRIEFQEGDQIVNYGTEYLKPGVYFFEVSFKDTILIHKVIKQ